MQEDGRVVEDEVHTGPLLHHLKRGTENCAAKIRSRIAESALEAVGPGRKVSVLWDNAQFIFVIGDDLSEFLLDILGVHWLTTDTRQDACGLLEPSLDDEVSWRFREEKETSCKDSSWNELNGDRDTVGAAVEAVFGAVVNASRNQQTKSNGELVARNNSTANLAGSNL